jgi:hypothetical protein
LATASDTRLLPCRGEEPEARRLTACVPFTDRAGAAPRYGPSMQIAVERMSAVMASRARRWWPMKCLLLMGALLPPLYFLGRKCNTPIDPEVRIRQTPTTHPC